MRFHPPHLLTLLLLALGHPALAAETAPETPAANREDYLRHYAVFAEAVSQVQRNYAEPIDRDRLFQAALRGMMAELDPYSTYLDPEEYSRIKRIGRQSKRAVGVELAIERGRIVVLGVHPGSPAETAGVQPSERVVSINGRDTEHLSLAEADRRLAQDGPSTTLQLMDADGQRRTLTLSAESKSAPTVVSVQLVGEGVGYCRVRTFTANTTRELRDALKELREQGANGIVLDLRFNSGGLLQAAVEVADLLLARGKIVSVVARDLPPREWNAGEEDTTQGVPLAVLVNGYSASASEVVAAALKDNGRAVVVGQRTFGKGSVQSVIPLGNGASALKLTTAAYVRPNGKNIHRFADSTLNDQWGVSPSKGLGVELDPGQSKALLARMQNGAVAVDADTQLQAAVEHLLRTSKAPGP